MSLSWTFNPFSGTLDALDSGGLHWRDPVATEADLPLTDADGTARVVLATDLVYVFQLSANKWHSTGLTVAAFNATGSSTGLTSSTSTTGNVITPNIALTAADATHPGGVSTTTQTFAGDKTFNNNVNITGTTTLASLNGVLKASAGVVSGSAALANLQDVSGITPVLGEVLGWTGTQWSPINAGTVSAGVGISFWPDETDIVTGPDIHTSLETLLKTPTTLGTSTSSVAVTPSTPLAVIDAHLYNIALGLTSIPSGAWKFTMFPATSAPNVSFTDEILTRVNKVVIGAGTATITGSGTTRTVTSSSSMFVSGDFNASLTSTSFIQLPDGFFPISAYTSGTSVDITVPSGYVNTSSVAYSVHRQLFYSTTGAITSSSYVQIDVSVAQPAFTINNTDKLSFIFLAQTSGNTTTIGYQQGGNNTATSVLSPLPLLHNDLGGLQGGSGNEQYHLSQAQYTVATQAASGSQNGYLTSTDWTTFNNKQNALTFGNITTSSANHSITGGTGAVIGSGVALTVTEGNLTESTSSVLTITGGTNAVLGTGTSIQVSQATTSTSGYLSSTDWNTFNNKQSTISFASVGNTPNASGATISSGVITLEPADSTHPGLMSTTSQTFAGDKNFSIVSINNTGAGTVLDISGSGQASQLVVHTAVSQASVTMDIKGSDGISQFTVGPTAGGTTATVAHVNGGLQVSGPINTTIATNKAVTTDGSNNLVASSVTATELGYVSGVTSSIQTQLNSKVSASTGDINPTSFSITNNQVTPADVTSLAFANGTTRGAEVFYSIYINATTSLYEDGKILLIQRGSDWIMSQSSNGDYALVDFTITTAGQVQYVSANYAGFVSGTIKFRASTLSV